MEYTLAKEEEEEKVEKEEEERKMDCARHLLPPIP